jgi:hypothetical protein
MIAPELCKIMVNGGMGKNAPEFVEKQDDASSRRSLGSRQPAKEFS